MLNSKSPLRRTERFSLTLCLAGALVFALSSLSFGQTSLATGSIVGTVTDASGAVLAGAKITITGPTGQTITATSGNQGGYTAGGLIPGAYTVRIEAKGF